MGDQEDKIRITVRRLNYAEAVSMQKYARSLPGGMCELYIGYIIVGAEDHDTFGKLVDRLESRYPHYAISGHKGKELRAQTRQLVDDEIQAAIELGIKREEDHEKK